MWNRDILLSFTACLLFTHCNTQQKEKNPNVLFIAVDDLKPMLGCYGDTLIKTPNIDALAQRGHVFMNNHCQVAVCGASRASLLTGLYADQTKVWAFDTIRKFNPEIVTIPQHFKDAGYKTLNIGKIFDYRTVDKYSDSISWDYVFPVSEEDYYPHYNKQTGIAALYHYQSSFVKEKYAQYKAEALAQGVDTFRYAFQRISPATERLDVPDDAYKDGMFAKLAIEQIADLSKSNQSFFLAVGFHKPHLPFVAPEKYWNLYPEEVILTAAYQKMAGNPVEYAYHNSSELRNYTDSKGEWIYEKLGKGEKLSMEEQKHLIHAYMATVSFVDEQVGKIIQELKSHDMYDNTIIVLWGDHGWHLGDHNMWGKASNFEQATRSPLILSAPDLEQRKTSNPSSFVDIYPTLCEMAGLSLPDHLEGESLMKIMNNESTKPYAVSQYTRDQKMGYAVRDKRYRYVSWVEEGFHVNPEADLSKTTDVQLFDYEKDPLETVNFANHPEYDTVLKQMESKLHSFYKQLTLINE